jgi:hypothetical protein
MNLLSKALIWVAILAFIGLFVTMVAVFFTVMLPFLVVGVVIFLALWATHALRMAWRRALSILTPP